MIQSGVGKSDKTDNPSQAGKDAAMQAAGSMEGKPDLLIVLSSVSMKHPEILHGVSEAFPDVSMVGCSTAGEITQEGSTKESVVVMALKSDQMYFTVGLGGNVKEQPREAGRQLAETIRANAPEEVTAMLLFSDVLGANGTQIHRGILDVFGINFTLVGGAAGDDLNFKDTHEYYNGEVHSGICVGVGLSGRFTKAINAKHGWEKVGADKTVTKVDGTTVYEINGKPAFDTYKEYLGEEAEKMREGVLTQIGLTYPLGMTIPGVEGVMIRTPLVVNNDDSIAFGAEVMNGASVSIMMGTHSKAIEAAQQVAQNVMAEFVGDKPKAVFISDCIARKKLLGPDANTEIDKVMDIIGRDVPTVGFYSYGQHAPIYGITATIDACDPGFYEESIVIFALGE